MEASYWHSPATMSFPSTPTSTTFEFALSPRASLEDEPGSAVSLAFSFEIPDDVQPALGSPIYIEERVRHTEDMQQEVRRRRSTPAL